MGTHSQPVLLKDLSDELGWDLGSLYEIALSLGFRPGSIPSLRPGGEPEYYVTQDEADLIRAEDAKIPDEPEYGEPAKGSNEGLILVGKLAEERGIDHEALWAYARSIGMHLETLCTAETDWRPEPFISVAWVDRLRHSLEGKSSEEINRWYRQKEELREQEERRDHVNN